jgi:hypothetical protein
VTDKTRPSGFAYLFLSRVLSATLLQQELGKSHVFPLLSGGADEGGVMPQMTTPVRTMVRTEEGYVPVDGTGLSQLWKVKRCWPDNTSYPLSGIVTHAASFFSTTGDNTYVLTMLSFLLSPPTPR